MLQYSKTTLSYPSLTTQLSLKPSMEQSQLLRRNLRVRLFRLNLLIIINRIKAQQPTLRQATNKPNKVIYFGNNDLIENRAPKIGGMNATMINFNSVQNPSKQRVLIL